MMLFDDRVLVSLGPLEFTWYGLAYLVAVGVSLMLLRQSPVIRSWHLSIQQWLDMVLASLVGILVGGRLGYVVWYEPEYFWRHPLEVFQVSGGGMSVHGGVVGVALTLWFLAYQYRWSLWQLYDAYVIPAAVGIGIGRVGNIINDELFVTGAAKFLGITGNFIIAWICWRLSRRVPYSGMVTGWWLVLYGFWRFGMEFVREPSWLVGYSWLTRGHLLALGTIMLGGVVLQIRRGASRHA